MRQAFNHRMWLAALVVVIFLAPVSSGAWAAPPRDGWLEQLTGFVLVQQGAALVNGEAAIFDLYLDQLTLVRRAYWSGDRATTYAAMNHFMDMLEAREGALSATVAEAIWEYCYQVTPPALHDVKRHKQWWDKKVDWDEFFWGEG